jgi:hypothetical protein
MKLPERSKRKERMRSDNVKTTAGCVKNRHNAPHA